MFKFFNTQNGYFLKITLHYDYETAFRGKLNYHKFSRVEKSQLALNKNSYIRNPEILLNTSVSFMYKLKKIILILALLLPRRGNMKTSNSCLCSLLLFFFGLKCTWNIFYETSHFQLHIDICVYCNMSLVMVQFVWHPVQHMAMCISYLAHREGNQMFFQRKSHIYSEGVYLTLNV